MVLGILQGCVGLYDPACLITAYTNVNLNDKSGLLNHIWSGSG